MVAELKMVCHDHLIQTCHAFETVAPVNVTLAVQQRVEVLAVQQELQTLGIKMKKNFQQVFSEIPHINELPTDVYCHIRLKDTSKTVQTHTYSTPRKYREVWAILIKQHLDMGRI